MEPDLAQLRTLAAVVAEGSLDAAAARLHLTPSAVSQRLKALERSAGRVLVRRSRPVRATDAGQAYLRLARQIEVLVQQAQADAGDDAQVEVPLAVTADALDTWVVPALAAVGEPVRFDLRREDQEHTAALLRAGTVMAAITAQADPVPGCRSTPLGSMRYRPMASPAFVERWFAGVPLEQSLGEAPVVVFDRRDDLQDAYLRDRDVVARPPRHHVPASAAFVEAVTLGLGWGMLPDQQVGELESAGRLVAFDPPSRVDVTLFWQQWKVETPALARVAAAVRAAAAEALDPSVQPAG